MSLAKGLAILGGVIGAGAALVAGAPLLTVSAPFWGIMGSTYTVNATAAAGIAAATGAGYGVGKIAGQTGGALVIEGLDNGAKYLLGKIKSKSDD